MSDLIIYEGHLYETGIKIDTNIEKLSNYVYKYVIQDMTLSQGKPIVVTSFPITNKLGNSFKVNVYVVYPVKKIQAFSEGMDSSSGRVNMVIGIPTIKKDSDEIVDKIEKYQIVLDKVKEAIYHEFLHIIDPKTSKKLINEPFNKDYNKGDKPGYHTQILEIEQFLSSNAKLLIEKLVKENKDIKKEISTNLSKYLIAIDPSLNIPRAKKLFAKLLYYYYDEWLSRNET